MSCGSLSSPPSPPSPLSYPPLFSSSSSWSFSSIIPSSTGAQQFVKNTMKGTGTIPKSPSTMSSLASMPSYSLAFTYHKLPFMMSVFLLPSSPSSSCLFLNKYPMWHSIREETRGSLGLPSCWSLAPSPLRSSGQSLPLLATLSGSMSSITSLISSSASPSSSTSPRCIWIGRGSPPLDGTLWTSCWISPADPCLSSSSSSIAGWQVEDLSSSSSSSSMSFSPSSLQSSSSCCRWLVRHHRKFCQVWTWLCFHLLWPGLHDTAFLPVPGEDWAGSWRRGNQEAGLLSRKWHPDLRESTPRGFRLCLADHAGEGLNIISKEVHTTHWAFFADIAFTKIHWSIRNVHKKGGVGVSESPETRPPQRQSQSRWFLTGAHSSMWGRARCFHAADRRPSTIQIARFYFVHRTAKQSKAKTKNKKKREKGEWNEWQGCRKSAAKCYPPPIAKYGVPFLLWITNKLFAPVHLNTCTSSSSSVVGDFWSFHRKLGERRRRFQRKGKKKERKGKINKILTSLRYHGRVSLGGVSPSHTHQISAARREEGERRRREGGRIGGKEEKERERQGRDTFPLMSLTQMKAAPGERVSLSTIVLRLIPCRHVAYRIRHSVEICFLGGRKVRSWKNLGENHPGRRKKRQRRREVGSTAKEEERSKKK